MKEKIRNLFSRVETVAFLLTGVFTLIVFQSSKYISDPDFFWHIKTGQYVLVHHVIPKFDVFSWWGVGKNLVWVAHEWLADIFMYLGYQSLGLWGLNIIAFVIFGCLMFLSLYYVKIRIEKIDGMSENGRGITMVLASMLLLLLWYPFAVIRPQLISFVLLVICAILFEKNKIWWTMPIIFFGINFHGGFWPIYFIVAVYYLVPKKKMLPLILIVLFTFLNPNTYYTFLYPFYGLMDHAMRNNIQEWQPVSLFAESGSYLLSFTLLFMVLIPKKKIPFWDLLFILAFSIQAIRSLRFILFFPLMLLPIFVTYIDYDRIAKFFADFRKSKIITGYEAWKVRVLKQPADAIAENTDNTHFFFGINLAIMGLFLIILTGLIVANVNVPSKNLIDKSFPIAAVQYIKAHPEVKYHLLNEYGAGGYLIFNNIKTFADGRSDPFTVTFNPKYGNLDDYFNAMYHMESSPKKFFSKYDIRHILWNKNSVLYYYVTDNPDDFTILYQDKNFFIAKLNGK